MQIVRRHMKERESALPIKRAMNPEQCSATGRNSFTQRKGKTPPRLDASEEVSEAIRAEAHRQGMSVKAFTALLWEFYSLERLDLLIRRLRQRYEQGLSQTEITQYSVLFSFLQSINRKYGTFNIPENLT